MFLHWEHLCAWGWVLSKLDGFFIYYYMKVTFKLVKLLGTFTFCLYHLFLLLFKWFSFFLCLRFFYSCFRPRLSMLKYIKKIHHKNIINMKKQSLVNSKIIINQFRIYLGDTVIYEQQLLLFFSCYVISTIINNFDRKVYQKLMCLVTKETTVKSIA